MSKTWPTLEGKEANPQTKDIPVLMFSAKKITPDEAREHSLNIEDLPVSHGKDSILIRNSKSIKNN